MKHTLTLLLIFGFTSCKSQSDSAKMIYPKQVQEAIEKTHYFSTTKEEYNYIVGPTGLLKYVKGLDKIKANYTLESAGIDGYTKDRDIELSYLKRWEGNKVYPCAFVVAFLQKEKIVYLKCIPIDNVDEELSTKTKNDFKKIGVQWMPNFIQLLLNLASQYAHIANFY